MNLIKIINRRYQPIKLLGRGGSGEVYLVREKSTGRELALKDIRLRSGSEAGRININSGERAGCGLELLRELNHSGIPAFHDFLSDGKRGILIMEYIEGKTLWEESAERGGIAEKELISILTDLCDILIYLHDRRIPIIYRDIKPSNIMLRKNGTASLIDFNSAVTEDSDYVAEGTGYYASPEHFCGRVDRRSDIYSLGKTALRVSGSIRGMPLTQELTDILKKATEKESCRRYRNAYELKEVLTALKGKEAE